MSDKSFAFHTSMLDKIPENTVVVSGLSLLPLRHMPTPVDMTTAVRGPQQPGHLYEILAEEFPPDHPLQLLGKSGSREITLSDLASDDAILNGTDYLLIPPLPESTSFETFQNTVAILRGPHGCPWDKKQTHQSIRDDFLQEVYELLDGLDRGNTEMIIEELGDVLFHVVLQTQMGIDNGEFRMGDVISYVNNKIISRHRHVFGNPEDISPDQVTERWEQIKQKERAKQHRKGGLLDGISIAMPALSQSFSCQKRAAKAGIEWESIDNIRSKLIEEAEEFITAQTLKEKEEELGDLLFCIVSLGCEFGIDPESALRMTILKFRERVHALENRAREFGCDLFEMPREEKEKYWNEAKAAEKQK